VVVRRLDRSPGFKRMRRWTRPPNIRSPCR